MVQQNGFTLEVVYADSKESFKEHTDKNGHVYAEVEPDTEYFIRFRNDSNQKVGFSKICIDGKDLGYKSRVEPNKEHITGLWSRTNGRSQSTALRFNKLFRRKNNRAPSNSGEYDGHWTGCIEVNVYEYIKLDGYQDQSDISSNWTPSGDQILEGLDLSSNKKACNSIEGKTKTEAKNHGRLRKWKLGSKLATLKLRYCSAVGLIAAGILQLPTQPSSARSRPSVNHDSSDDDDSADEKESVVKKRRINNPDRIENFRTYSIQTTQTLEVVDLT